MTECGVFALGALLLSVSCSSECKSDMASSIDRLPNGEERIFFVSVDGSFCNRNFLRDLPNKVIPIARA